jgi:beta-phosphoglucomutase-like phosphatase (HAD superfamily)
MPALIFELDGRLVGSVYVNASAWKRALDGLRIG